jgi:hypothetical protein
MATKLKYEIDPHNRLTAQGPYRFRHVLDGVFKIGDDNRLTYHLKQSDPGRGLASANWPQQIKFSGQWSMDETHNLVLILDKWNNQVEGNKLVIATEIVDASSNELVFTAGTRDSDGKEHVTMLKFAGAWQADPYNRLTFCVEKDSGAKDELLFRGEWKINKKHEIEYVYRKARHTDKTVVTLSGYWDIAGNNKLSYVLSEDSKSRLDFQVKLERVMRNSIEASIGIGISPVKKKIVLSGRWHIAKGTDASFDVNYGGGKIAPIHVKLTKLLASGEAYVRFAHTGHEVEILGGIGIDF